MSGQNDDSENPKENNPQGTQGLTNTEDSESETPSQWEDETDDGVTPSRLGLDVTDIPPEKLLQFAGNILVGLLIIFLISLMFYSFAPHLGISEKSASTIWDYTTEFVKTITLLIVGAYFSKKIS